MNQFLKNRIANILEEKEILCECFLCENNSNFNILGFSAKYISDLVDLTNPTQIRIVNIACGNCGHIYEFLASVLGVDDLINVNPYKYIQGLIRSHNMSILEFQNNIKESEAYVSSLLKEKIRISSDFACKLERIFNVDADSILIMQENYYK